MVRVSVALALLSVVALAGPADALTLPELLKPAMPADQTPLPTPVQGCCKHCSAGKACGDTCISRSATCHVGPGCACNG